MRIVKRKSKKKGNIMKIKINRNREVIRSSKKK